MTLTDAKIKRYQRSLKLWMGYVAESNHASLLDVPVVTALGWLLDDGGHMPDFLQRYQTLERDRRRKEVRQVVLLWLAELAV